MTLETISVYDIELIVLWGIVGCSIFINSLMVSFATRLTNPLGGIVPRNGVVVGSDKTLEYIVNNT